MQSQRARSVTLGTVVRVVGEIVVWAALAFGIWMVTLSSITTGDLELAAPSALLAGVLAAAARRFVGGVELGLPPGVAGWLVRLPVAVVTDTAAVLLFAASALRHAERGRSGTLRWVQLPREEDEQAAETRRSVAALILGATPGSFPVDNDAHDRRMLIHELVPTRPPWAAIDPAADR